MKRLLSTKIALSIIKILEERFISKLCQISNSYLVMVSSEKVRRAWSSALELLEKEKELEALAMLIHSDPNQQLEH